MPDRSDYLAKTIVARLRSLEAILREDLPPNDPQFVKRRTDAVAKILAVDAGVTDGITVQTVISAVPNISLSTDPSTRDMAEFADFLRKKLPEL
ncbi:hypothetical protein [Oleiharenicola lentus]|uniref:hypothetical protein n=1 Tax=Oleiharenicola lentus TaxID=2508720 RepID=UPI003F66E21D